MCEVICRVHVGVDAKHPVIEICAGGAVHLAEVLANDAGLGCVAQASIAASSVFKKCASCFEDATHALLEVDYFDYDYRSNASATLTRRFTEANLRTDRIVLMRAAEIDAGQPLEGIDGAQVLGYMILTGDRTGLVGRSLIPAPTGMDQTDADIPRHVRTVVQESIALFGRLRRVSGVPFLQQDGNLLTCAHVSAWMAHHTAVLRGLAPPQNSVAFHHAGGDELIVSRRYPSSGLTDWQLATLLERFGLPVEMLDAAALSRSERFAEWYDRDAVWGDTAAIQQELNLPTLDDLDPEEDYGRHAALLDSKAASGAPEWIELRTRHNDFWLRESLTTTVCQYLNSGFPAIVHMGGHTWTVNGYLPRGTFANRRRPRAQLTWWPLLPQMIRRAPMSSSTWTTLLTHSLVASIPLS